MALIIKQLGASATSAGGETQLVSSSASTIVANIRIAATGSQGNVNVKLIPATGDTILLSEKDKYVAAGDMYVLRPEITLGPGDKIVATTSVAMQYIASGFTRD